MMTRMVMINCISVFTRNALVSDFQKLFVTARIGKSCRRHRYAAGTLAGADTIQVEVYVDVAVPVERYVAPRRYFRIVPSVSDGVEQQYVALGARQVEYGVETCVLL